MADWQTQCWDSTVFISLLTGQNPERSRVIRALLDHHKEGRLQIVVTTFAIAEVRAFRVPGSVGPAPGQEGSEDTVPLDEAERQRIAELFASDRLVYRALTDRTGLSAAEIGNTYPSLLPGDCVHIATALEAKVDVLFTYDGAGQRRRPDTMLRYDKIIGTPPLRIMEPFDPWPALGLEFVESATPTPARPEMSLAFRAE
jgi:predicted nucleic acid-binding protein